MKLAALLFAATFARIIFGFAAGLFVRAAGDTPPARAVKPRGRLMSTSMAIDLESHRNVRAIRPVYCDPSPPESPNDYLALLRAKGAL